MDLCPDRRARVEGAQDDVHDLLRIFYGSIGGARVYAREPVAVKSLCLGLRRPAILERYRDAGDLVRALESLDWS